MLASQFLQKLQDLDHGDINNIHGIGDIIVENLHQFVLSPRFEELKTKLQELESQSNSITIQSSKETKIIGKLSDEIICITGTFDQSRPNIKLALEKLGAKVTDNVTNQTTILLAGIDAGSKLTKAKKLEIKIVEDINILIN